MPTVTTKVAGTTFRDIDKKYLVKLATLPPRQYPKCKLVRQPDNAADPNAVKVVVARKHIGFVPRELAARVAEVMDAGTKVTARLVDVTIWEDHPTSPSVKIEISRP